MPELPEVESLRRSLEPRILGRAVAHARTLRDDYITGPRSPHDLLVGATLAGLLRLGKRLAIVAHDGRTLEFHLGMTGGVTTHPATREAALAADPHTHLLLTLRHDALGDALLAFRDPRRFGGVWTHPSPDHMRAARWSALGPDALTIPDDDLHQRLHASRRPVKSALLDQAVLAGVGNIYADEALFLARIGPRRRTNTLSRLETSRLAHALRSVLADAIHAGGSTLRDYANAGGEPGDYQRRHAVYGRAGLPCPACQTTLRSTTLAGRTTVYCPACQVKNALTVPSRSQRHNPSPVHELGAFSTPRPRAGNPRADTSPGGCPPGLHAPQDTPRRPSPSSTLQEQSSS